MGDKSFHRGIRDLKIALWNNVQSWGTAYDLHGARNATLRLEGEFDTLRGDDIDLAQWAKATAVTVSLEQAAVDLEAAYMLTGGALVYNADYEDLLITESSQPLYLGVAGRIVGNNNDRDLHFLVFKAKMSEPLDLQAQHDQWMLPRMTLRGVSEGGGNGGIMRIRKFTALTALEIPLRTTTGGV